MIDDLYSARILGLAANLPHAGRLVRADGTGERVARLCGSRAIVDVTLDDQGLITDFAQDIKACALGQAAAGVIGEAVIGATADEITTAATALTDMLKAGGEGPEGRFEGLRVLKPVADYPQRHASTQVAMGALVDAVDMALATSLATRDIPEAERTRRAGAA
ncbi:iron-sulfur cluster assembly scaffold protein [Brevundimonas halotolerans]|uniref:NifU-like protein involved in Fe-S cluster formation n=1 Tax=Brevundimonas halotolerans TaxID=69670 RepID=A0A7W9A4H2_9CAUL|nr:iron-sulfur cluster assembly scaffold protein [Brevundimonas halotolerans]MBB5661274.1 NifU-like protein involved in Fe-S cluster formation [Brevundimonas halotolerans]